MRITSTGMGGHISISEINAFAEMFDIEDKQFFFDAIKELNAKRVELLNG